MITIIIEGPEKSGKSHAIALIGKYLKSLGCNVTIQSENTHNASKLAMDDIELAEYLRNTQIIIKEMQTSV
jgi:thymidylate kinase